MITVKFFGMFRLEAGISQLLVEAGTVRQVLDRVMHSCPKLSERQLKQALLFVNKKEITGSRRLSIKLKDGDELVMLSPMSGG